MPVEVEISEQLSVQSSQRNKTKQPTVTESLTYKRVLKGLLCGKTVILVCSIRCCLFPFLQVSELFTLLPVFSLWLLATVRCSPGL